MKKITHIGAPSASKVIARFIGGLRLGVSRRSTGFGGSSARSSGRDPERGHLAIGAGDFYNELFILYHFSIVVVSRTIKCL